MYTHTHIHLYVYIYIYIYMCVCVNKSDCIAELNLVLVIFKYNEQKRVEQCVKKTLISILLH